MIVYHGSSTLPDKEIPKASESAGVFVTPQKELAQIFGRKIHIFEIEESLILNLQNETHRKKAENNKKLYSKIDLHESGLPYAFNHVTSIDSLEAVKHLALSLGFKAAYFFETNKSLSIEVWDNSILKYLKSEDNDQFDELNK